jgi:hypothetical protein
MFRVKEAVVRLGRYGLDLTEHKKLRYQDAMVENTPKRFLLQ